MRILYLADIRFPLERANGVQTMETVWHLAARGHSVTMLVRPDTAEAARDPFRFYGVDPLPTLTIRRALVAGPASCRRALYLIRAVAAVSAARFDLVFTRDLGVASAILRLPASRRPPVVYESHGYAPDVRRQLPAMIPNARPASAARLRRLERRERRVWAEAQGYVTITRALADDLTQRYGPRARVLVAHDGVRAFEPPANAWTGPADPPTVVYAGHLYAWKGVDVLIAAARLLPAVRVRIIGGMPGEPDLERLRAAARTAGLSGRVEFTGFVPPSDVRPRLLAADVLVLPNTETSVSARYTSPLKLFEYLAAGRPVVASRLPALEEVLVHERNALLVTPGDPAALAAAVRRLVDEPALGARLASQGLADVAEYSWTRRAERLSALFDDVVTHR